MTIYRVQSGPLEAHFSSLKAARKSVELTCGRVCWESYAGYHFATDGDETVATVDELEVYVSPAIISEENASSFA